MVRMGRRRWAKGHGFVLIAVMFLLFVTAMLSVTLARRWELENRAVKERDLLWIGGQFRLALASYAAATPAGLSTEPRTLDELLRDTRVRPERQHLRRLYIDPMTGNSDWGLVLTPAGGIAGVYSRSAAKPLERDRVWPVDPFFPPARRYSDWVFSPARPVWQPVNPGRDQPDSRQ